MVLRAGGFVACARAFDVLILFDYENHVYWKKLLSFEASLFDCDMISCMRHGIVLFLLLLAIKMEWYG